MNKQKTKLTAKKKIYTNKTLKHNPLVGGYGLKTKSNRRQTDARTRKLRRKMNNRMLRQGNEQQEEQEEQPDYTIPPYVPPAPYETPPPYVPPAPYEPVEPYSQPEIPTVQPYEPPAAFEKIPPFQNPIAPETPPEEPPEKPELSIIKQESFKQVDMKNGFTETIIPNNKQPPTNNNINVDLCATIVEVGKNINHKYMFPSQFPVITNFYKQIPEKMIKNQKNI